MSELVVIGYDNQDQAELARNELFAMKTEHLVDLIDAVVATSDEKGRIRLNQMVNLWATGAAGGALWGLLAGILFFYRLLGVAVGGATGALAASMGDFGISDSFMKDVGKVLAPGQAALFLLVNTEAADRMIGLMGMKGGHVLRTNLDHAHEEHLKRSFHMAHTELRQSAAAVPSEKA